MTNVMKNWGEGRSFYQKKLGLIAELFCDMSDILKNIS